MDGDRIRHPVAEFVNCPLLQPGALETWNGKWEVGGDRETPVSVTTVHEEDDEGSLGYHTTYHIWAVPEVMVEMMRVHGRHEVVERLRRIRGALEI